MPITPLRRKGTSVEYDITATDELPTTLALPSGTAGNKSNPAGLGSFKDDGNRNWQILDFPLPNERPPHEIYGLGLMLEPKAQTVR